ncbi:hypothetical protein [Olsenella urininfantis]|uniref:hypothetical protein n=1 Tax=Olsenella urininfantis TaxID=1871033 RepID=UPI00098584EE|nr:hypothetical protein [Olsenella urininfantis]
MLAKVLRRGKGSALAVLSALALACCVLLTACGGSGGSLKKEVVVGSWVASSLSDPELGELTADDLNAFGLSIEMVLEEDGSGSMSFFGEPEKLSWEVSGADKIKIKFEDTAASEFKFEDGKLVGSDGDSKMVFERGQASSSGTSSSGSSKEESSKEARESIDYTIADDDYVSIKATSVVVDEWGDPGFDIVVTNKSDKELTLHPSYSSFSVNGKMIDPWGLAETVKPGTYAQAFMYFDSKELGGSTLDALKQVEGKLELVDSEYDTVSTYDFSYSYGS